jgi:hypothetical protein
MKYLKLYEDFYEDDNNNVDPKELLEEILSLDYILKEEGARIEYYVREKQSSDSVNMYLIGDSGNIKEKIEELEECDDFPKKIYSYEIRFQVESTDLVDEYFNKLKYELEDIFDVKVEKSINYRYKPELRPYAPIIKVFVEKTPDDYGKGGPLEDDDDINESIDNDNILSIYGLYPEDIYDIFYDFTDSDIFGYSTKLEIDFSSTWTKVGGSKQKPKIEKQPRIYVLLKFDENNLDIKNKNINIVDIIEQSDVFKVVKNRLNEHNLEITSINLDYEMQTRNRFVRIIIKKV